ncbi:MAG: glycosyltransferase family 2 protein [Ignavibacteriales bacterium]|nr:glycosyltransferase family 2 protein [Ignavibacteriales bacterium]
MIIVNWNAGNQLRECLASIVHAKHEELDLQHVIVVDNASTDSSIQALDGLSLPVLIVANKTNHGFGAACNQGVGIGKSEFILFLNPDTRLNSDSIVAPLRVLSSPASETIGIMGVQLVGLAGCVMRSCSRFPTTMDFLSPIFGLNRVFPSVFRGHMMVEWAHNDSRTVDHVIGAFYLVRRSLFERLGGFDERFFVYLEDLDFSLRAKKVGFECYYCSEARAYHKGGGASEQTKAKRLFYSLESRVRYAFKNFSLPSALAVYVCTLLFEPLTRIFLSLCQRSARTAIDTLKAYGMLWARFPLHREARGLE